jgi:ATP:ADP antiporter, AAA family
MFEWVRVLHRSSGSPRREPLQVALLSAWFFVITAALWLLKPVRTAALLSHLGSAQLPILKFSSVLVVGLVVLGYSRVVNRLSRLQVTLAVSAVFVVLTLAAWAGLVLGEREIGGQRWFVWSVYCLADAYAAIMVTIFWTYTNDVVSAANADRLYAPIGLGGILGGIAGGGLTDSLVHWVGTVHLLLACAGCLLIGTALAWANEAILAPPPRVLPAGPLGVVSEALEGAQTVLRSEYLLWMVGIVISYETAATLADFVVNVILERSFQTEIELAQMYGRLGWIAGGAALFSQLVIVPALLPNKRIALLVPPLVMAAATLNLAALPGVAMAIVMAASDRGLNYSLQQITRETLYVRLGDTERYKAKAFIDIFVDRAAKALASVLSLAVMLLTGTSISLSLALALIALAVWTRCAHALGQLQRRPRASDPAREPQSVSTRTE